jgi:hypothetical protein
MPEEQLQEHLRLKEFVSSLLVTIGALGSPLGPHLKSNLAIDLYSNSTPIANKDESDCRFSFNLLNKSMISLLASIGALGSPLRSRTERDLAIYLYFSSTSIASKDALNRQIRFRWLQEIYNITTSVDQGIWLSSRNSSKKIRYRSILCLCPSNPL